MDQSDQLYRHAQDAQKERKKKERKEKWSRREKKFWRAFLFTKDGKPKSGLMIYTFCLSFVFLLLYIVAFNFIIEWLDPVLRGLPAAASNLIQSVAASCVGILAGVLLHVVAKDKRLFFGSHLWLALYDIAALVSVLIMLRGTEGTKTFLVFYLWFMVIPVVLGLLVSYLLYRRDHVAPERSDETPEWKKYVQRR